MNFISSGKTVGGGEEREGEDSDNEEVGGIKFQCAVAELQVHIPLCSTCCLTTSKGLDSCTY